MDLQNIRTSRDAVAAGLPVFKVMSDGALKAAPSSDGTPRVVLTASTSATDLVGDVMSQKALQRMQEAAPSTLMFLNHSYNVPEDVFGSVEKAEIVGRTVTDEAGNVQAIQCLDYTVTVETANPRALKTFEYIQSGKARLGASVSILITDRSDRKDGRRVIDDVYYLECSIVGIPCNQQSWVQGAKKALQITQAQPVNTSDGAPQTESAVAGTGKENRMKAIEKAAQQDAQAGENGVSATNAGNTVPGNTAGGTKGFFQDEMDETTNDPFFLVGLLLSAVWDWRRDGRDEAKADEMISEFSAAFKTALMNEDTDDDGPMYWSADRLVEQIVSKSGKRNSAADQERIQAIHDKCLELGAKCAKSADASDDNNSEESETTPAGGGDDMKALEIQQAAVAIAAERLEEMTAKAQALTTENTGLREKLTAKAQEAEQWKASSLTALEVVRQVSRQPLPRAGRS